MRIATSCSTCRSRKKKCVALASGDSCVLCRSKKRPCDVQQIRQSLSSPPPASPSGSRAETWSDGRSTAVSSTWTGMRGEDVEILNHPVMDELIEIYFDMIHNKQLIVFHRNTFYRDRLAGCVPPYHLLGIAAIVARFSAHPHFHGTEPTERGLVLARQAKFYWDARQPAISIQALQGTILLGFAFSVQGERDEEALLSAQALRMVQILQLPQQTEPGNLQYEIEIRLFWHAFMMDVWHSGCLEYPRQLQAKTPMPLPLEEEAFENMRPADDGPSALNVMEITDRMRHGSIMANVVRLHTTYADIIQLNRMIVHEPYFTFLRNREVQRLSSELQDWLRGLPAHLRNTPENLEAFAAKSRGREFAVLHIIYHHQCQLLYYQYLQWASSSPSEAGAAEEIFRRVARCKAHAEALSALMWTMNTFAGSECLWSPVNGHLLVVASSIHLHSLLFDTDDGDGDDDISSSRAAGIRQLLEQNFVMLLQFQKYWPTLKASLRRLAVFHRSCYRRARRQSFRMDVWMFDFLTKHDVAMEERGEEGEREMVPDGVGDAEMMWSWLSNGSGNATQDQLLESLSFS